MNAEAPDSNQCHGLRQVPLEPHSGTGHPWKLVYQCEAGVEGRADLQAVWLDPFERTEQGDLDYGSIATSRIHKAPWCS